MSDFRIKMKDFGKKLRSKRLNILAVALLIAFILIVIIHIIHKRNIDNQ